MTMEMIKRRKREGGRKEERGEKREGRRGERRKKETK